MSNRALAEIVPVGSEFLVNTYTTLNQHEPDVSSAADGAFVVVWQGGYLVDAYSVGHGVFGRRYDSAGAAQGSAFRINTHTLGNQVLPAVASAAAGAFVVVWESADQDGADRGVFGQRYDSTGLALGTEFQVNTYTTSYQRGPAVAADAAGSFVVVWESDGQDGSERGVFGQRYDSAGVAQGSEFQVNTHTMDQQAFPAVAVAAAGAFVVVWDSRYQDGASYGVFGQRYDSAGVAQGSEFQVNTYTIGSQVQPAVVFNADDAFVVVWGGFQQGSDVDVFARRYDSAGVAQGSEFQVNTYTFDSQNFPVVAASASGAFLVVWYSHFEDGSSFGVFARCYDSAGRPQGGEFQVNTYTISSQVLPAVAADPAGDIVVVWQSSTQDGSGWGVFGQRYVKRLATATAVSALSPSGALLAFGVLIAIGGVALRRRWRA